MDKKDNNDYAIWGIVYNKEYNDDRPEYPKWIITLDVEKQKPHSYKKVNDEGEEETHNNGYKTYHEFPQFEALAARVNVDSINLQDPVKIKFSLSGWRYKSKVDGKERIFNKNVITWIGKDNDLDAGYPNHVGKIKTEEKPVEKYTIPKKMEDAFPIPDPDDDPEGMDQLPF